MSTGMDVSTLLGSLSGGGAETPPAGDPIKLLTDALTLVRQATDLEPDPQMSVQLEQISSMIQKALATDHADTLGSLGMKPGMSRVLSKAAG